MTKTGTTYHLIKLLDDESEKVREKIITELHNHVDELEDVLQDSKSQINDRQRHYLENILAEKKHSGTMTKKVKPTVVGEVQQSLFNIGQIVRHKRYGYRGVIVDFDTSCKADPDWYLANKTQPERNQAWYHVFVHQTDQVTYAAQSSLTADENKQEIEHPFIDYFFKNFTNGEYIRNQRPWPMESI